MQLGKWEIFVLVDSESKYKNNKPNQDQRRAASPNCDDRPGFGILFFSIRKHRQTHAPLRACACEIIINLAIIIINP